MWVFTEVADWFDKTRQDNEKWIDSQLQPWVGTTLYDDSPWYRNVGIWTAAGTLYALNKFTTTIASGFVDVLRLGDGVQEGGWGYGKDALRLLMVVGPALRGVRWAATLVTAVDETPLVGNCSWIAATRAARWTGVKPLATLGDLAKAQGLAGIGETGGAWADELLPALRNLGARADLVTAELNTVEDVAKVVAKNPNAVTMFSVEWEMNGKMVGHTLFGVRRLFGGMAIIDRSGGQAVSSLKELEGLYAGIGKARVYGSAITIDTSLVVRSIGTLPTLGNIISQAATGYEADAHVADSSSASTSPAASAQNPAAAKAASSGGNGKVTHGTLAVKSSTTCLPMNSDMITPICTTSETKYYKVGNGEGLSIIAQRVYGDATKWPVIAAANGIKPPKYVIRAGQVLLIP